MKPWWAAFLVDGCCVVLCLWWNRRPPGLRLWELFIHNVSKAMAWMMGWGRWCVGLGSPGHAQAQDHHLKTEAQSVEVLDSENVPVSEKEGA